MKKMCQIHTIRIKIYICDVDFNRIISFCVCDTNTHINPRYFHVDNITWRGGWIGTTQPGTATTTKKPIVQYKS